MLMPRYAANVALAQTGISLLDLHYLLRRKRVGLLQPSFLQFGRTLIAVAHAVFDENLEECRR